jgi:hypothetical protein
MKARKTAGSLDFKGFPAVLLCSFYKPFLLKFVIFLTNFVMNFVIARIPIGALLFLGFFLKSPLGSRSGSKDFRLKSYFCLISVCKKSVAFQTKIAFSLIRLRFCAEITD